MKVERRPDPSGAGVGGGSVLINRPIPWSLGGDRPVNTLGRGGMPSVAAPRARSAASRIRSVSYGTTPREGAIAAAKQEAHPGRGSCRREAAERGCRGGWKRFRWPSMAGGAVRLRVKSRARWIWREAMNLLPREDPRRHGARRRIPRDRRRRGPLLSGRLLAASRGYASSVSRKSIGVDDLADDAFVCTVAMLGAPTVLSEKAACGDEIDLVVRLMEKYQGRRIDALMPIEIGGLNSLTHHLAAARLQLPLVDADGMGARSPRFR